MQKQLYKYMSIILIFLLSSCSTPATPAPLLAQNATIVPISNDQSFITIDVSEVQILNSTGDIDNEGEFRLLLLASDGEENSGGLFCPGDVALRVHVGDTIKPCSFVLSIHESKLKDELYLVIVGVDEDTGNFSTDVGSEFAIGLLSKGLWQGVKSLAGIGAKAVSASTGNPLIVGGEILFETAVSYSGGKVKDWIEEQDVIGIQGIQLTRNQDWQVGHETSFTTEGGGLHISYRVYRTTGPVGSIIQPSTFSQPETTPIGPLGTFSFGRASVLTDNSCQVEQPISTISQEDLLKDEWIYFATPFDEGDIGKTIFWSVYKPDGSKAFDSESRELSSDLNYCFWQGFGLEETTEPGEYVLEVLEAGNIIFRQTLTVNYADLSQIPRPVRDPIGGFTFGRDGLNSDVCKITTEVDAISKKDLEADEWFYFASSFTSDDIGKVLYWSVYGPDDTKIHDHIERVIEDDVELCWWQGFALTNSAVDGNYLLVVELDSNIIYEKSFQLHQ